MTLPDEGLLVMYRDMWRLRTLKYRAGGARTMSSNGKARELSCVRAINEALNQDRNQIQGAEFGPSSELTLHSFARFSTLEAELDYDLGYRTAHPTCC